MEDEGDTFLRNVQDHLPGNTASHLTISESLIIPLWKTSKVTTKRSATPDTTHYGVVKGSKSSEVDSSTPSP